MKSVEWTIDVESRLRSYVKSLEKPEVRHSFLPCMTGVTAWGKEISLGFSCFALRLFYILGWWEELESSAKKEWVDFINSFFIGSKRSVGLEDARHYTGGYVDIPLNRYLLKKRYSDILCSSPRASFVASIRALKEKYRGMPKYPSRVIVAETKQAISSLVEVGASSPEPFRQFPHSISDISRYLDIFDWSEPWEAGGQTATLAVFLNTEAPRFIPEDQIQNLIQTVSSYYTSLADPSTGAYFCGHRPTQRNLVNGAMKVVTALDWLGEPIHYPEKLIDTTLAALPEPQGCDLVDSTFVLYRCSLQTKYRRQSVLEYANQLLELIRAHHNPDGGFSYNIGCAQKWYYGVSISKGLNESDLHGTFLLVWALSMIFSMLEEEHRTSWNIIKP